MQELKDCKRTVRTICASSKYLISGNFDKTVNVYELSLVPEKGSHGESGVIIPEYKKVRSFDIFESMVYSVAFLPSQNILAVGCKNGSIYIIGLSSDLLQVINDAHAKNISCLSFGISNGLGI